jgi:hypothetical protein
MKRENPAQHFIIPFVIAMLVYVGFYRFIEHRRVRQGAWTVTFTTTASGQPELVIKQAAFKIENFAMVFSGNSIPPGASNLPATFEFRQPRQTPFPVPFGKVIFIDPTFLPGTVTFQLFGHEIELLPRVLILDHEEYPWHSFGELIIKPAPGTTNGTRATP